MIAWQIAESPSDADTHQIAHQVALEAELAGKGDGLADYLEDLARNNAAELDLLDTWGAAS